MWQKRNIADGLLLMIQALTTIAGSYHASESFHGQNHGKYPYEVFLIFLD